MFSWGGFPCNPYINLTRVGSVHQRLVLSTSLSVCVLCKSVIKAGKPKKMSVPRGIRVDVWDWNWANLSDNGQCIDTCPGIAKR